MCELDHRPPCRTRSDDCPAHYLVAFDDPITSQDICEIVLERDPGALVHHLTGLNEVAAAIEGAGRIAVAFIGADIELAQRLGLLGALQGRCGRLVLLGHLAEDGARVTGLSGSVDGLDWAILQRPFDTSAVHKMLEARFDVPEPQPATTKITAE